MNVRAVILAALACTACSAPSIQAELTEITAGADPAIKVRVKGKPKTFLSCTAGELTCPVDAIGSSGFTDLTIKIETLKPTPDKIVVWSFSSNSRSGKHGEAIVDLKKKPGLLDTTSSVYVSTKGIGRKCDAIISWGPHEKLTIEAEEGAVVEIAGTKLTAGPVGIVVSEVKGLLGGKAFADLPLEQTMIGDDKTERGTFPLTVTYADGTKLSATLHLTAEMAKYHTGEFFKDVPKGTPALLPGETAGKPSPGAHAAFVPATHKLLGKQVHSLREIEYVVVQTESGTRTSTCKYQSGATASLTMFDAEVKLFERRTGHVSATKTLQAPNVCDETVSHKVGTAMPAQSTHVSAADVEAWVNKQLGH